LDLIGLVRARSIVSFKVRSFNDRALLGPLDAKKFVINVTS